MVYFILRKLSGHSFCLRALRSVLKPGPCQGSLLHEVMRRRDFGNGGPARRNPYQDYYDREYESYYDYEENSNNYDFGRDSYRRQMQPERVLPESGGRWRREVMPIEPFQEDVTPIDANCGQLRHIDIGTLVRMRGRVQYQRLNRFISLRDSHGTTQLVALEERLDLIKRIRNIPVDSHIEVIGIAQLRPSKTINASMPTGEVEVVISDIVDVAAPKRKMPELGGEAEPGRTGKKSRSSVLITSSEIARCETPAVQKKFQQRTHNCGELNESHINSDVSLCGWIDNKRSDRFVILRDGYGTAQLVINTTDFMITKTMEKAEANSVITVKGKVSLRPPHQRNTRMATGNIEVKVTKVEIVDPHEPESMEDVSADTKIFEEETSSSVGPPPGDVNSYSVRTHTCGELRGSDVGKEVILCGWLDSERGNRFATMRDGHGCTQVLVPPQLEDTIGKKISQTALESVIMVMGTVCARPPEKITEKIETGEIEVVVKDFSLLNAAKKDLPFIIRDRNKPKENMRMKYRYLDLRFSDMQYRMRLRSKVLMRMREFLINQRGFVEVETPTLFRRTPGGAQEYIVPTRSEGKFYSLVQSPQQLKQLLMVGAIDRYFQVARCYRDEGARPDRQPEFTQMDIELSFTDRELIMSLVEDLLQASWPEDMDRLNTPFLRLTYHDAMHWYGTDKPNLSFDKKLIDISELMTEETKQQLPENLRDVRNFTAKALVFGPNYVNKLDQSFKACEELLRKKPNTKAKLILVKCSVNRWKKALAESLSFLDTEKLKDFLEFPIPCSIVVGFGKDTDALPLMGKLRQDVFGSGTSNFHFAWIVDFPLFLEADDGSLESAHHPFTLPHDEDLNLLDSDPLKVRGQHFDLVLNGYEVGGGSVRIHNAKMQTKVLQDILKIPIDSLEHLLEALKSGAPPHGGIALGMDRLLATMLGAESIRDVIAFPKGVDGRDPLCGAPCDISDEEKRMYHLLPKVE